MLTFNDNNQYSRVFKSGEHIGDIMLRLNGKWFYQPRKGARSDAGPDMNSRDAVKQSLESGD